MISLRMLSTLSIRISRTFSDRSWAKGMLAGPLALDSQGVGKGTDSFFPFLFFNRFVSFVGEGGVADANVICCRHT